MDLWGGWEFVRFNVDVSEDLLHADSLIVERYTAALRELREMALAKARES